MESHAEILERMSLGARSTGWSHAGVLQPKRQHPYFHHGGQGDALPNSHRFGQRWAGGPGTEAQHKQCSSVAGSFNNSGRAEYPLCQLPGIRLGPSI